MPDSISYGTVTCPFDVSTAISILSSLSCISLYYVIYLTFIQDYFVSGIESVNLEFSREGAFLDAIRSVSLTLFGNLLADSVIGNIVKNPDENGKSVINRQGELVCAAPLPSMPIYFWDDPDNEKYHNAYFDVYPNIWRHGDFMTVTDRGGVVIHGRSDATLKPGSIGLLRKFKGTPGRLKKVHG